MEWNFLYNVWMFLFSSSVVLHVYVFIKYLCQLRSIWKQNWYLGLTEYGRYHTNYWITCL